MRGEIGVPRENLSVQRGNNQTQPTFDAGSENRTRATMVGGECSHHCAIPAPDALMPSSLSRLLRTPSPLIKPERTNLVYFLNRVQPLT